MNDCGIEQVNEFPIHSFYESVDQNNFEIFFRLISEDIKYERQNYETSEFILLDGKPAFENFYRNERKLVGTHKIESIKKTDDGSQIDVIGEFQGEDNGAHIRLRFEDFWTIQSEKVIYRRSLISRI
jgi:ketosteroid isomerase-like protein